MTPLGIPDSEARILIVDDERPNRDLLEIMLKPEGFQLQTAEGGEEAVAMVALDPPDLILLDVMMPGMTGYDVARKLKGDLVTKNIPIIMVTDLDDRKARILGLNCGAEDFLSKPVDRAELCVRVRNLIRLKAYGDYQGRYSEMLEGEVLSRTALLLERTETLEKNAIALERSEENANFALTVGGMGVWEVLLPSGEITWSSTLLPMFGVTSAERPHQLEEFWRFVHHDDVRSVQQAFDRALRGPEIFQSEFRVLRSDGSIRWLDSRGRVQRNDLNEPVHVVGVAADITERKSLEAQFRQAQKMDAIGQLAGGIAHDFNNLLTAILGYSSFVIDSFGPQDLRRADMEEIIKAGDRAAGLTRQLLAFSRKQVLQPTAVDVNALVAGMRQMLSRLIGEHVELISKMATTPCMARADAGQLEQVLMNLVVNARDAMGTGGKLTIETADVNLDGSFMHNAAVAPGSYVMLAVSDNGCGMDDATKQRLFEPFFTTKEQGKGTGLGLATVYGIVKQSGGYVWVYSEVGKGSTFKVYLPCARAGEAMMPEDTAVTGALVGTESVLVVEDDEAVRLLTRTILERSGYKVASAANPKEAEALSANSANRYDLLVTDVIMPGLSGPNLFAKLERQRPDLRVLYVSGYTDDTIVQQGQLKPGVEFLQKPFTADALNRRVREVLDRHVEPLRKWGR